MKNWIDTSLESDNVIVASDSTLYIGSCDEEHYDEVGKQLDSGKSPQDVLGSDNLTAIPYSQIQNLTSKNSSTTIEFTYKTKQGVEHEVLGFDSLPKMTDFTKTIDQFMPSTLEKTEFTQSPFSAAMRPLFSLVLCAFVVFFYIDKFRWPVIVVGALWAAVSLYFLLSRLKSPSEVTRWNIKGHHARKAWAGLKSAGAVAAVLAFVGGLAQQFPDSWGEKSISDRLAHDMLSADDVSVLVSRGGDINYVDEYDDTPLEDAIYYEDHELAVALIDAGADMKREYDEVSAIEFALNNSASKEVLESMLKKGTTLGSGADSETVMELVQYYEDPEVEALFKQYMPQVTTSLD